MLGDLLHSSPFLQAENRATEAERTVSKLQKEVDRLEGRPGMTTELLPLRIYLSHSEQYLCLDFTVDFSSKSKLCTVNVFLISQFILQCHK